MEITSIDLVKGLREIRQGQSLLLIWVTKGEESFCNDHRQMAKFCEGYLVDGHCLQGFLFDASLCNIVEELSQIVFNLLFNF
jgi:hypothetical protein